MKKLIFVDEPLFVVSFYGRLDEVFQSGMRVVLVDRKLKNGCQRIVKRVFDQGNGCCIVDLI